MKWLAMLARYLWTFRQRDDECKAALERYRAIKTSGAPAPAIERAWLNIPLWCKGRPDKP
jgi:hypothetical protein